MQTCPNSQWPRQWTTLPTGYAEPEVPPLSVLNSVAPGGSAEGGQAILVGGGYINKCYGRNGWAILVTYLNGWPHCSLTAYVAAGVESLPVNDCTGWAITDYYGVTGATGRITDSGQQEAVHVTSASVTSGPGNLILSSATNYPHQAGTIVTTLPASVEQACIYFCHRRSPYQGRDVHDDPRGRRGRAVLRGRGAGTHRRGRASHPRLPQIHLDKSCNLWISDSATLAGMTICAATDDCPKPAFRRGWCTTHYERWKTHGDFTTVKKPGKPRQLGDCPVDDGRGRCGRPAVARDMCSKHWQRWKKFGDPTVTKLDRDRYRRGAVLGEGQQGRPDPRSSPRTRPVLGMDGSQDGRLRGVLPERRTKRPRSHRFLHLGIWRHPRGVRARPPLP